MRWKSTEIQRLLPFLMGSNSAASKSIPIIDFVGQIHDSTDYEAGRCIRTLGSADGTDMPMVYRVASYRTMSCW